MFSQLLESDLSKWIRKKNELEMLKNLLEETVEEFGSLELHPTFEVNNFLSAEQILARSQDFSDKLIFAKSNRGFFHEPNY